MLFRFYSLFKGWYLWAYLVLKIDSQRFLGGGEGQLSDMKLKCHGSAFQDLRFQCACVQCLCVKKAIEGKIIAFALLW